MTDDTFRRIDALIGVGMRIARSAPSGQVALARLARAIDPAWIPRPWGEQILAELEAARAAALEPIDVKRVERILREAWSAPVADELDEFDPDPVAVTPGAQVHRGVLDGSPVAIKVLRPGLAASVRQDLVLLEGLIGPLEAAFPKVNARALLRETRERVLDELDLEHEAQVQRRFHRALRGHPFLTVPAPVTRLAHDSVLVSEWVDGVPLRDAPDRDAASARLVVFAIGSARAGVVHADLYPEDVLVLSDGRLAILDFGAARTVEATRVERAALALEAFVARDPVALGEALEALGWLPALHAGTALELGLHALGELAGPEPATLDTEAVVAARERLLRRPEQIVELALGGAVPPEDLWPTRGLGQLFSTIARVDATGPWRELMRSALREGWDARSDEPGCPK
jgi:predicted unusual protein kinase regulating ubiquinone biosynthesis (AarF/ABC1/UbiB family)